jgi:asparagine synthase (glutamine-hydrolysing)
MRGRIPGAALTRPKHGFMLPLDRWLREELRAPAEEATRSLDPGRFCPAEIERLWAEHLAGRHDHSYRLWLLWVWSTTGIV